MNKLEPNKNSFNHRYNGMISYNITSGTSKRNPRKKKSREMLVLSVIKTQ